MNDELLIKLVRGHDLLYNKLNKDSRKFEKKEAAWQRIANEMGASKTDCIRRWTHLRNRYSKECRRMEALEQNGKTDHHIWAAFNDLKFLDNHIIPRRKRITNINSSYPLKQEHSTQSLPEDERGYMTNSENISEKFNFQNTRSPITHEETAKFTPVADESIASSFRSQLKTPSMKKPIEEVNFLQAPKFNNSTILLENHQQSNHEFSLHESNIDRELKTIAVDMLQLVRDTTQSRHKNPAVHAFGQMIVETICSMNERKQALAMQKMTEIAMKLKMECDN